MTASAWTTGDLPDLSGRTVVVTGASSGIGAATARALAAAGAHVVLAVRDPLKGERVAEGIDGDTEVRPLDLADLASVRAFARDRSGPLDILINNAGDHGRGGGPHRGRVRASHRCQSPRPFRADDVAPAASARSRRHRVVAGRGEGALPTLFATTQEVPGGAYIGPDGGSRMRMSPVLVPPPAAATDSGLARALWDVSADLTGLNADRSGANLS